ncbi:hypothetical protein G6F32_015483 [Rhizopus arrhizus]|nr:hypothetical protein G6F32_015483 [Rhizopus arrhizus]
MASRRINSSFSNAISGAPPPTGASSAAWPDPTKPATGALTCAVGGTQTTPSVSVDDGMGTAPTRPATPSTHTPQIT